MKEVLIIIRPNMYFATKKALAEHNFFSISSKDIISCFCNSEVFEVMDGNESSLYQGSHFVAKKLIEIFCRDEDLQEIIDLVLDINKTGHSGDGMIYVVDLDECIRIRTNESGINAIM